MIGNTLDKIFSQTQGLHTYVPAFGEWGFQMAFMKKNFRPNFSFLPKDLQYFSQEIFEQSKIFPADIDHIDTLVNTLNRPVMVDVYAKGWEEWE